MTSKKRGWRLGVAIVVVLFGLGYLVFLGTFTADKLPSTDSQTGEEQVIAFTNLVLQNGYLVERGQTDPFTGRTLENYGDGSVRSRNAVSNGVLHGLSEGFFTNGVAQVNEHFENGVSHGVRRKWYADGSKRSEAEIENGVIVATFRRWHQNGQLSEEIEMRNGKPDGLSRSYYPSGFVKAEVAMGNGEVVTRETWEDGERKLESGD